MCSQVCITSEDITKALIQNLIPICLASVEVSLKRYVL